MPTATEGNDTRDEQGYSVIRWTLTVAFIANVETVRPPTSRSAWAAGCCWAVSLAVQLMSDAKAMALVTLLLAWLWLAAVTVRRRRGPGRRRNPR